MATALALAGQVIRADVLVPAGSSWKYLTGGANPGPTWTEANFDDQAWLSGPGPLGDNVEGGVQQVTTVLDIGPTLRYPSVVFRKRFVVADASAYAGLTVRLQRDDGAAVYLNGSEIVRDGLQPGAALSDYTTAHIASGADETTYYVFTAPATALVTGTNVLAVEVHNNADNSSDLAFDLEVIGEPSPQLAVAFQYPPAGSLVASLVQVEVRFNATVVNVDAFDLLVNDLPATNLIVVDAAQYIFQFPQPPTGVVQMAFGPNTGIQTPAGLPLQSTNWTYVLDTNYVAVQAVLNEFMAANNRTLRDQDGNYSDWIELYNPGTAPLNLSGYHLTDDPDILGKWTFPAVVLNSRSYLVVFASGQNRAVAGQQLHTNFRLDAAGEFLALVAPDGTNVVQAFRPGFPPQTNDISYGFVSPGLLDYMETPTPGAPNVTTRRVQDVSFSVTSGTFINPFSLVLTSATPGATIYYTLNGSTPTNSNQAYSSPIPVNGTVQVRAWAVKAGLTPSAVRSQAYIQLDAAAQSFSSDLPIIVLDSFGSGIVQSALRPVYMMVFEVDSRTGRATLTNSPAITIRAGLRYRGASSGGFPKHQFKLETWDEEDQDADAPLLGLPAESDWVLNGDYTDESLIRNPLVYDFGRELGLEAPRSRFSEVFLHTSGGVMRGALPDSATTSYYGVLSLMEFIKIGRHRVNVDELGPSDNAEPNVTGGYILRFEKDATQGPVLSGWRTLEVADPNTTTASQLAWISAYMNSFRSVVMGPGFKDPTNGYRAYVDVDSVVNYLIINELTHAQDAYVRSSYLWKDRGGKLVEGPLWDYNLAFGLSCCFDSWRTNNWTYTTNPTAELYWNIPESQRTTSSDAFPMYERFLADPDFSQLWVDRYQGLRQNQFRQDQWNARVDRYAAQVLESQARNFTRWQTLGSQTTGFEAGLANFLNIATETWPIHVQVIKDWSRGRMLWMDAQFPAPVGYNLSSGFVPAGTPLLLTNGTSLAIYYTLDGTDPRAVGGGAAPGAIRLTGNAITLNSSATIVARSFGLTNNYGVTNWSRPTVAHFYINSQPAAAGNLVVTEINYHPADATPAELLVNTNLHDDDFEFIELRNIGTDVVDLFQARFTNGIHFDFTTGAVQSLAPGQYVLLVKNRAAFALRYGAGRPLAGEYEGNLDNAGERLTLVDWQNQVILDFEYRDGWYPTTDGLGFTLVAADETVAPADAGNRASWRFSSRPGGSPAVPELPSAILPVFVNEVLTFPIPPAGDAIELFNPNPGAVDLSGWFLTDDFGTPMKYRIPDGTNIAAGGFLVFNESQFNAVPGSPTNFGLSSHGEAVWLFSADAAGNFTGYAHGFSFGGAAHGETFGRYFNSVGEEQFPPQIAPTLGTTNLGPRVGPIVITKINYHPHPGGDEFVELLSLSNSAVPLFDPAHPTNTWKLSGLGYTFPTNVTLGPNARLLLVATSPAYFRAKYSVPAEVQIFGPYSGALQANGERLELQSPDLPATNGAPFFTVDAVRYNDQAPWPTNASGTGISLQRRHAMEYGDDPANWIAVGLSPGADSLAGSPPAFTAQPQPQTAAEESSPTCSVSVSGTAPLFYQWYFNGQPIGGAFSSTLVLTNVQLAQAGEYSVLVLSGSGRALSTNAHLTVLPLPVITQQPLGTNVTLAPGVPTNVTLRVSAIGTGTLRYQWQFNGADLPGTTNSTLTISNAQASDSGVYQVIVTDAVGSRVSEAAMVNFLIRPSILQQPQPQTVAVGDTASFGVTPTGTIPLGFRWRRSGVTVSVTNLPNGVVTSTPTNSTLTITNVQLTNAAAYTVVVTNLAGQAPAGANAYLVVVLPPTNQTAVPGSNVVLRAVVASAANFTNRFSWVFNGTTLQAGTATLTLFTNDLVLTNVSPAQSGDYTFILSNWFLLTNVVVTTNFVGAPAAFAVTLTVGVWDSDGDGIPDWWTQGYFGHPTGQAGDLSRAGDDADGDGMSNAQEYQAGTDPTNALSVLQITAQAWSGLPTNVLSLRFTAMSNKSYSLQYRNDAGSGAWSNLLNFGALPTNRAISITNALPDGLPRQFYRLRTPQAP